MTRRKSTPPLHWLKAFEASANTQSFTRAAEVLLLTQSAVSKQVKNLELYLKQDLFRRERGGLSLTEAGMNYLPTVVRAFAALEQGTRNFLNYSENVDLSIKANNAFASFWLCQNIGEFMDLYPMIRCTMSSALWEQDFSRSSADVEIHYGKKAEFGENALQLTNEQLVPVCAPAIYSRIVDVEDFKKERILDLTGIRDNWDYWAAQMDIPKFEFSNRHFFGTFVLSMSMAAEGIGITLAHSTLARAMIRKGELVAFWNMAVPSRDNFFAVKNTGRKPSGGEDLFLDWLKQRLADQAAE